MSVPNLNSCIKLQYKNKYFGAFCFDRSVAGCCRADMQRKIYTANGKFCRSIIF